MPAAWVHAAGIARKVGKEWLDITIVSAHITEPIVFSFADRNDLRFGILEGKSRPAIVHAVQ